MIVMRSGLDDEDQDESEVRMPSEDRGEGNR